MPIRFDRKPGLVVYLTAGDPSLDATREIALAAIDAGADVIELGVPFSDPLADGPIIQRASERALARGTRLKDVLALAREIRAARPAAGLVLFSYLNPILRYGLARFAEDTAWLGGPAPVRTPGQWGLARFAGDAAAAGVDGVLATDLIVEEAADYLAEMDRVGLAPIFLAAPTSPDARLEAIAKVLKRFCLRHFARGRHRQAAERGRRCSGAGRANSPMDASCRWPWGSASATRNTLHRWRSSRMPR